MGKIKDFILNRKQYQNIRRMDRSRPVSEMLLMMFRSAARDARKNDCIRPRPVLE